MSALPKNEVHGIGIVGWPGSLRGDQLKAERVSDLSRNLVLHGKQISPAALEPLGSQMRVAFGLDQLGADAYLVSRSFDASVQHIAHAKLAADLFGVDRFVPVGERRVARNHEHVQNPRQIGRHIVGNPVGNILLIRVAT